MACDWSRTKSKLAQAGIDMCSCILRAREEFCWSWSKPDTDSKRPRISRICIPSNSDVMLLLAVDTSGKHGSIALAQCGPDPVCQVLGVAALSGGTFSAELVPQIAA